MDVEIKPVDVQSILSIRHQVLRQGKPISSCHFDGDNLKTTYHIAAYIQNEIVGCVSLMSKTHSKIQFSKTYQLRGMAVLENHQGKKIGRQLLLASEACLKPKNISAIWCNVRIKAVTFYKKYGYIEIGKPFEIPEVGEHILMFKSMENA